ncbi:MAG TPA: T9SS type A sorting domain-containing protein, partial [Puia sp.]|nr:T9SS type A sorting domain-containing protein [Puia sp.]
TATATAAGSYTLTATNPTTGCTTTVSTTVTQVTTAPNGVTISTANNVTQLTCATNYIGLTGSSTTSGVSYNWTGPNNYSVASSAVNVFNPGVYTLTVTNPTSGCVSTAAITITQNITPPANVTITPSLAILTCANPSAILTGNSSTSGVTYNWTGPNSFTATGVTATVISQGSYILTVTDPTNGCTNTTTATISQNFTPPANVTAVNSGPLTCSNTSVNLTGNSSTSNVSYSWTGPNNFTSSNAIATTNSPGIYTLTVTNPVNGCSAIATTVVTQNDTVPAALATTAVPSASQLTCTNSSVVFTASSSTPGVNYSWSGSGGVLSSSAVATATAVGTYTVTATNPVNGCTATTTATVTQNIAAPAGVTTTANPVTAQITCTHPSVVLTSSAITTGVTYSWSGPGGYTATGTTATVTAPGVYTVSVTDPSNGCVTVLPGTVTKNVSVPVGLAASASDVISCFSPSIDLQGVSTTPGATFSWSGPGGFTAATAIAETDVPGNYTLIVTNPANGCTASTGTTVTADTASPAGVTASNSGPLNCINTSVTLTSSSTTSGVDYLWVTPDNNFISGASTVVTTAGLYTIVVTNNNNGCSSQATTTVLQNTTGCTGLSTLVPGSSRTMSSKDITVDTVTKFTYKAYPNPFSTTAFIEFKAPVSSRVTVEIYSSYGSREKSLFNSMVTANQPYKLELSAAGLSSGTHFCIIRNNDKVYSTKLILIK